MALQPFYQSATGDPTKLVRALAWQALDGVPNDDMTKFHPFRGFGGPLTPSMTYIDRQLINRSAQKSRAMDSKIDFTGQTFNMGDLDPADFAQAQLMLQFMQGYDVAVSSGWSRYRFSQQQAVDGTAWNKVMTYLNDTDKGIPARFADLRVAGFTLTLAGRANANLTYRVRNGKVDFWPEPTVTGTGTVKPILRHYYSGNFVADATDNDIYIKIISDSATQVVFQVKVASAGTYSANITATKGVWTYCWTGASAVVPLGPRRNQIQVYFPTGADNAFVDNDVWLFENRRAAGMGFDDGDYTVAQPIAEVQARFFMGDQEIAIDNGVTLTADAADVVTRYAVGGEQPVGTDRKGQQAVTVAIDRRLVDMELQKQLLTRDDTSLVIECVGDTVIAGGSGAYYGVTFVLPLVVPQGEAHDAAEGANNYNEQITMLAAKPDSNYTGPAGTVVSGITDFASDLEAVWDTDIAEADLTDL